jgi:hypothetical protein
MNHTYPQIDSPAHLNGHATEWQLQIMISRVSQLEEDNAALRQRGNEWRDLFVGTAVLALFLLGVLITAGWRLA